MLVGGVVDDQLGDDADAARVRLVDEALEVVQRAVARMDVLVVGDVVAVVAQRRRIERQQPERVDAELLEVVELLRQAGEVADAVVVAVEEGADVHLVDDGVLVPERIIGSMMVTPAVKSVVGGSELHVKDVRDAIAADRGGRSSTRRARSSARSRADRRPRRSRRRAGPSRRAAAGRSRAAC